VKEILFLAEATVSAPDGVVNPYASRAERKPKVIDSRLGIGAGS
jgi:hypothetical protein